MKKLLYFVPFILIGLSLTPFALHKDTVNYGTSLDTLSPSHWKVLDMQVSFSGSLDTFKEVDPNQPAPEPEPVSKNATFKGFPFGAYFSRSESNSTGNFSASAYSLLWAIIDLLLIVVSLVISFKVNRKKKETAPISQPIASQPSVNTGVVTSATPQVGGAQPGVFTPTQPPQQTTQPSSETAPQSSESPQTPPQV